jgi:hypothetical protein
VVLHRHVQAVDALRQEQLHDLGRRLGLRHPVGHETRRLERTARLGPAGHDPGLREGLDEVVAKARRLRGVQPAAEPDARGHHEHVGRVGDELAGRGQQTGLVEVGLHAERRRGRHLGAAPLQGAGQLVGSPLGGHQHGGAGQDGTQDVHDHPVCGTPTCTTPSTTSTV